MAKHGQQQVEESVEQLYAESGLTEADEQAINKDLEEAVMSPQAKAAKKHIEDLAKKNNKSFGDQRMHIDDFPGKHDKKTQDAAKALNKHQYGEEVEQVDELSKSTLGSYVKKASQSAADHGAEYGKKSAERDEIDRASNRHGNVDRDVVHKAFKTTQSDVRKPNRKVVKRLKGINTAVKKMTKEQVEQVDEVDRGFGSRMKAADAAANIYSKEKRKPENDTIRAIRKKYADKKKEEQVDEKTLTPAEKKKREDVAKAIERDNPDMPMDKKMAIATAHAKKVAESVSDRTKDLIERAINKNT